MATNRNTTSATRPRPAGRRSRASNASARSRSRARTQRKSQNGRVQTVESAATKAWSGTGTAGRVALGTVAGGAALGLAGRAAFKRGRRPRMLGGRPNLNQQLGELAKQVGRAGASAGALAIELRQLREQADERKRQSPIEVVLSALTSRGLPRH